MPYVWYIFLYQNKPVLKNIPEITDNCGMPWGVTGGPDDVDCVEDTRRSSSEKCQFREQ